MTKKKNYKKESQLVSAIKKALAKEFGGRWIKIHGGPYQEKGVSDILGCLQGIFIAIEVKMPGKEKNVTDLQQKFLDQIKENGGVCFVSTDVEETINIIRSEVMTSG